MAVNIGFKRGLAANLPSQATDGIFYLTTDTNRLYVGQGTSLVELNKSITIVDSVSDLPTTTSSTSTAIKGSEVEVGQFYYVKSGASSVSGNILAVCSAITNGNISWTQVNPDTDTNTSVSGISISPAASGSDVVVTLTLNQQDKNNSALSGQTRTATTTFSGDSQIGVSVSSSKITLTGKIAVGMGAAATNSTSNDAVISLSGVGAAATGNSVTIKGGTGTNVAVANNEITISSTGAENVSGVAAGSDGKITISKSGGGSVVSGADLYYKIGSGASEQTILNQGTLPVYTKTEIDDKIKGINAVTYKGTVANQTALAALSNISIGDAYMVSADGNFTVVDVGASTASSVACKAGDLLVATGTEGSDGYITSASLKWTRVPSGNDVDTQYTVGVAQKTANTEANVTFTANTGSTQTLGIDAGTDIVVTASSATASRPEVTVAHKTYGAVTPAGDGASDGTTTAVVTGLTLSNGHVTGIATHNVATKDTQYKFSVTNASTNSTDENTLNGKFSQSIQLQTSSGSNVANSLAQQEISSTSLYISSTSAGGGKIDLVWGTF